MTAKIRTHCRRYECPLLMCLALTVFYPAGADAKCKPGEPLTPGDHAYNIDFAGKSRSFTVHVPPKYDGRTPVALVFDLHGFSSSGTQQLSVSGFPAVADANGFIVVAPDGYMNSWNGDIAYGSAYEAKLDDVGLMNAIVQYVAGIANINLGKVYSTGLSNGAAMSNTLGCQATDTFAGVAPVADPLDIGLSTCKPARPTSVLGFHGYSDEYVPYEGGTGSGPALPAPFPNIPDTLKNWAMIMGCSGTPELISFQGRNKCEIYRKCKDGVQVGYCSLEGSHFLYEQDNLNIAEYAWKFFDMFSIPLPDADGDGVGDTDDNCVTIANADQADSNGNCVGNACECTAQAGCDDGKFCNGSESCASGVCDRGASPCAAMQQCDEGLRTCVDNSATPAAGSTAVGAAGATAGKGGNASGATAPTGGASDPGRPVEANAGNTVVAAGAGGAISQAAGSGDSTQPSASTPDSGCGCHVLGRRRGSAPQRSGILGLLGISVVLARRKQQARRRHQAAK